MADQYELNETTRFRRLPTQAEPDVLSSQEFFPYLRPHLNFDSRVYLLTRVSIEEGTGKIEEMHCVWAWAFWSKLKFKAIPLILLHQDHAQTAMVRAWTRATVKEFIVLRDGDNTPGSKIEDDPRQQLVQQVGAWTTLKVEVLKEDSENWDTLVRALATGSVAVIGARGGAVAAAVFGTLWSLALFTIRHYANYVGINGLGAGGVGDLLHRAMGRNRVKLMATPYILVAVVLCVAYARRSGATMAALSPSPSLSPTYYTTILPTLPPTSVLAPSQPTSAPRYVKGFDVSSDVDL